MEGSGAAGRGGGHRRGARDPSAVKRDKLLDQLRKRAKSGPRMPEAEALARFDTKNNWKMLRDKCRHHPDPAARRAYAEVFAMVVDVVMQDVGVVTERCGGCNTQRALSELFYSYGSKRKGAKVCKNCSRKFREHFGGQRTLPPQQLAQLLTVMDASKTGMGRGAASSPATPASAGSGGSGPGGGLYGFPGASGGGGSGAGAKAGAGAGGGRGAGDGSSSTRSAGSTRSAKRKAGSALDLEQMPELKGMLDEADAMARQAERRSAAGATGAGAAATATAASATRKAAGRRGPSVETDMNEVLDLLGDVDMGPSSVSSEAGLDAGLAWGSDRAAPGMASTMPAAGASTLGIQPPTKMSRTMPPPDRTTPVPSGGQPSPLTQFLMGLQPGARSPPSGSAAPVAAAVLPGARYGAGAGGGAVVAPTQRRFWAEVGEVLGEPGSGGGDGGGDADGDVGMGTSTSAAFSVGSGSGGMAPYAPPSAVGVAPPRAAAMSPSRSVVMATRPDCQPSPRPMPRRRGHAFAMPPPPDTMAAWPQLQQAQVSIRGLAARAQINAAMYASAAGARGAAVGGRGAAAAVSSAGRPRGFGLTVNTQVADMSLMSSNGTLISPALTGPGSAQWLFGPPTASSDRLTPTLLDAAERLLNGGDAVSFSSGEAAVLPAGM